MATVVIQNARANGLTSEDSVPAEEGTNRFPARVRTKPSAICTLDASPRDKNRTRNILSIAETNVNEAKAGYSALTNHTIKATKSIVPSSPYPNIVASLYLVSVMKTFACFKITRNRQSAVTRAR